MIVKLQYFYDTWKTIRDWILGVIPNKPKVDVTGEVNINNLPVTQQVSGSVQVGNFPATQNVSGSVSINGNMVHLLQETYTIAAGAFKVVQINPTLYSNFYDFTAFDIGINIYHTSNQAFNKVCSVEVEPRAGDFKMGSIIVIPSALMGFKSTRYSGYIGSGVHIVLRNNDTTEFDVTLDVSGVKGS